MSENLQISLSEKLSLATIDEAVERLGMANRTDLVLKALDLMTHFDAELIQRVDAYSEATELPTWAIIQNMIIKRFADERAEYEVFGKTSNVLLEFCYRMKDGIIEPITGEELFELLKEDTIQRLKKSSRYQKFLKKQPKHQEYQPQKDFEASLDAGDKTK